MIVKRIRKAERRRQRGLHGLGFAVFALSQYLVDAQPFDPTTAGITALSRYALDAVDFGFEPGEKVEASGTFNLMGDDLDAWQMQMLAVAAGGRRMRDPIEHVIISWREDEKPSADQVRQAAATLLQTCGYDRCPAIWSYHTNTAKPHAHIMIVRVDPATGSAQGERWDIDRMHQAIALVEEKQGWSSEPNAIYQARGGAVYERATGRLIRDADGRAVAHRAAAKPLPKEIAEVAPQLIAAIGACRSWPDLHQRLEELGATYRRKGSGAVVGRNGRECKASGLARPCGLKELEKETWTFGSRTLGARV